MPYKDQNDKNLPSNVKAQPDNVRRQWVAVWNSTYNKCNSDGKDNCEAAAFQTANGVLKKHPDSTPKEGTEAFTFDEQALIDSFGSWASGTFTKCVETLSGKDGIDDPERLCAWLKDQYTGDTHWRGKGKKAVEPDSPHVYEDSGDSAGTCAKCNKKKRDAMHYEPGKAPPSASEDTGDTPELKPVRAFLTKLYELLKGNVSEEAWTNAIKKARGHAGGVGKRDRANAAYEDYPDSEYGGIDLGTAVSGSQMYKLEKADKRVNYRSADKVGETCGDCRFYLFGGCRLVEGYIDSHDVCNLFDLAESGRFIEVADIASTSGGTWRLFNEAPTVLQASEPPVWIPYLPIPGTYKHPKWGAIKITKERNEKFIQNFADKVYQDKLPLDGEHDLKQTGAIGWINEMRLNADSSVDAKVDWTDRGVTMLKEDRYRYVSPEWYDEWSDPVTDKVIKDVAIGGALTTRPFFKAGSLRPLVASERGLEAAESVDGNTFVYTVRLAETETETTVEETVVEETTTVEETTELPENNTENTDTNTGGSGDAARTAAEGNNPQQFAETVRLLESDRDKLRKMVEDQQATIEGMVADSRRRRFTELVLGKAEGSDGQRWYGEVEKHVTFLESLAKTFGEDSDELKHYVATQTQMASTLSKSSAFNEIGSSSVITGGAVSKVEAQVAEIQKADPKITKEVAVTKVFSENPELYADYEKERAGR